MLFKRVITSFLVIIMSWLIIFQFPQWVFLILTIAFIAVAISEFFSILEMRGVFVYKYFGIIAGCLIPVSVYLHFGENHIDLEPMLIVIACLLTFILQFIKKEESEDHFISIAATLLALFYVSWFFSFFIKIKFLQNGAYLICFVILVTKIGDVAAYLSGKAIGKHKLIPRISPKKTIEGTVSGLIASVVMAYISRGMVGFSVPLSICTGLLLGALGQVGDLAESLIKRDCGVKDAAKHLSGFGGVLDMIDSLLFTVPVFYFVLKLLNYN